MVGVQGFEPWTPCSQSRCATRLRYTPTELLFYTDSARKGKSCKIWAMVAYFSSKLKRQIQTAFVVVLLLSCMLGTHWIGFAHSISHAGFQSQTLAGSSDAEKPAALSHTSDICHLFDALTLAGFAPSNTAPQKHFLDVASRATPQAKTLFLSTTRVSYNSRAPPAVI